MRTRRVPVTVGVVLFFGGWGLWFANETLGFALMGAGALTGVVRALLDWSSEGGVPFSRAWREQSRHVSNARGQAGGGWFGGDGGWFGGGGGDGGGGGGGGDGGGGGGC